MELRSCIILSGVLLPSESNAVVDCIVESVESRAANTRVDHCNVFGKEPFADRAKPGKRCFGGDPQFRDPKKLDYRLKKTSPCRGRASDGGDVGVRYTPEMIEILKKALELRKKGMIKF